MTRSGPPAGVRQQLRGDAAAAMALVDGEELDPAAGGGHDADERRAFPGAEGGAAARAVVAEQLLGGDDVDAIVRQRRGQERSCVVERVGRKRGDVHGASVHSRRPRRQALVC